MSLAPSEEQKLAEIENQLRRSDLRLAARLVLFSHRPFHNAQGPARERISPWQAHRRAAHLMLLALVSSIVIALAVVLAGVG
jgi:hypothetical protein